MIEHYVEAVREALSSVEGLLTQWAMPLGIGAGLFFMASALIIVFGRNQVSLKDIDWHHHLGNILGSVAVVICLVVGWTALRTTRPVAQIDIRWRESADTTSNPAPDAPPVYQSGPAVAALIERTYTRTLTLPPSFLSRLGGEGVSVLAPYLSDPSSENVVRLRDSFRRSGRNAVFKRESTVLEEEPIPLSNSQVRVSFERLAGRAYDATFEGRYQFANTNKRATPVHFLFTLPDASTVRDLQIKVGDEVVTESSDEPNTYEWKQEMQPGEKREALVTYHVVGARIWSYDLGSQRRRVQQFQLDVEPGGTVRFLRNSLRPTSEGSRTLSWQLSNVVTAQKAAIVFPSDNLGKQLYLQALSALPASFILFFVGVVVAALWFGQKLVPARLGGSLILFALGLGASTVVTIYLGPIAGLIIAPLVGALLASSLLGWYSLLAALPLALLPATFLSAQNTGLMILLLGTLTLIATKLSARRMRIKWGQAADAAESWLHDQP